MCKAEEKLVTSPGSLPLGLGVLGSYHFHSRNGLDLTSLSERPVIRLVFFSYWKECKKTVDGCSPLTLLWDIWKERNMIVF